MNSMVKIKTLFTKEFHLFPIEFRKQMTVHNAKAVTNAWIGNTTYIIMSSVARK